MARRKTQETDTRNWETDFADAGKIASPLDQEVKESMRSYIDYALTERALPYIDGLKPVHRAILWCMWETNAKASSSYVKSAKIASDTIGAYHAHSQDAVYGAAAGLTRAKADDSKCGACKLNACLIDGRGNFGASWEDSPAAPRYTEQRLSKTGEACVRDTGSGAVFMNPTFDAKHTIPEVMPVRVPLLLMNGSSGLAYGYNVFWLPHNPAEAIRACILRLDEPNCSVADLKKIMPGPDFPGGGIAVDREEDGLATAYETGFGGIVLTSRYTIQRNATRSRHYIDFYETPYGVPRSGDNSIVEGITAFATKHPEYGIMDVKNLSGGKDECLIEVSLKSSVNPDVVAAALTNPSSGTKLTQTVSYRQSAVIGGFERADTVDATGRGGMLRLVNPKPRDVSVLGYIDAFIAFRRACVINSCEYERERAQHRKHMVDGLLKALLDIDEVIAIVRKSRDSSTAKNNLMKKFKLDGEQADYVLAIPLSRLTRSDKIQLEANAKKLEEEIKRLTKILSSDENVLAEIRRQLAEELEKQKIPRRTTLISPDGKVIAKASETKEQLAMTRAIAASISGKPVSAASDEPVAGLTVEGTTSVYLSPDGKISQTSKRAPEHTQFLKDVDLHSRILIVFENGNSIRMSAYEIPAKPTLLSGRCVGFMDLGREEDADKMMALATTTGTVKVLKCSTLTKAEECPVISLDANSKLSCARGVEDGLFFVFVTSAGNLLRFPVSSVNSQGRTSGGVAGIKLTGDATIICASVAAEGDIVVTSTGLSIKQSLLSEYPPKGRGSQGVRCHRMVKGEEALTAAYIGASPVAKDIELPALAARDASGVKMEGLSNLSFREK